MIKTILLADDSITMQKVIRLTFASGGYELSCADNGDEAIKKAEDLRPDIVLVDAALPGKNGYEVCEAIKNNPALKDTPVIILAGTFNPLDDKKARRAGCDDSIVKPFESRQLTEKVESLFKKYPSKSAPPSTEAAVVETPDEWAEDDIIRAPEPSSEADTPLGAFTETTGEDSIETATDAPDLDILEGRGIIEETPIAVPPGLSAETESEDKAEQGIPGMQTADGELEGEGGFDIEGFEINPFKSEPLRDKEPLEQPDETLKTWNVEENDLIGFTDPVVEPDLPITDREDDTIEAPAAEPEEDYIIAEDDTAEPAEEPITAAEEEPAEEKSAEIKEEISVEDTPLEEDEERETQPVETEGPSEELISELVKKITLEAIEEAVSDAVPALMKEVMEEAVREIVPGLIKEAMEEEMERIKKAIRGR